MAGDAGKVRVVDGGLVTLAFLKYPSAVAVDASENIYIVDRGNHRIRKVIKSTGIFTTVAGNGFGGYSGDGGLAMSALLSSPHGVAVDLSGNIYISDFDNNRIRVVTKSTGIITTVAGNGISATVEMEDWRHQLYCGTQRVSLSMRQGISTLLTV